MNEDLFGIPDSAVDAARKNHEGINRIGMYVPTRGEVRTLAPKLLYPILDQWMWESPVDLIPTNEQIADVLAELLSRPDQEEVEHIVAACRKYIKPPSQG